MNVGTFPLRAIKHGLARAVENIIVLPGGVFIRFNPSTYVPEYSTDGGQTWTEALANGVWPSDDEVKIGSTAYANFAAAYAAASNGDAIRLGIGTHTISSTISMTKNISIVGSDRDKTIIQSTDSGQIFICNNTTGITFKDLTIEYVNTIGGFNYPVEAYNNTVFRNVRMYCTGAAGTTYMLHFTAGGGKHIYLYDVMIDSGDQQYAINCINSGTLHLIGGRFDGSTDDIYQTTGTVVLDGATLINSDITTTGGSIKGEWLDTDGNTHYNTQTMTDEYIKVWNASNSRWELEAKPTGGGGGIVPWMLHG